MKLQARRAHRRLWTVLVALAVAGALLFNLGFWNRPEAALEPRQDVLYDQPPKPSTYFDFGADKWANAVKLKGYGTTYDAFYWQDHQSWFALDKDGNPGRNAWIFASKADCAKNPEWKCYTRMVGPYKKLVRPWSSTINNLYAALGPVLRDRIAKQMPRWHTIPTHKLRLTSLETGISVEVWITDSCPCNAANRLVDVSLEGWHAMGRDEYYVDGKRYYFNWITGGRWESNWLTVEYIP